MSRFETEVPSDHEFMEELADLVEKHEEESEYDREELFKAARVFGNEWLETLHLTGRTW